MKTPAPAAYDGGIFRVAALPQKRFPGGIGMRSVNLENLMMTFVEYDPGAVVETHRHRREQITYVLEGVLEVTVGDERQVIGPGEGVRVPRNVAHSSRAVQGPAKALDAWTPVPARFKVDAITTLGDRVPLEGESIG